MQRSLALFSLAFGFVAPSVHAQGNAFPLPKPALQARTVVILNETHSSDVEQGALEALRRWGKFQVVDDVDQADLTLTFDKKSEHEGTSSQKPDKDGKPTSSYSMSFSSTIHMSATLKGASTPFYNARTTESKKKAGAECITDLQQAFLRRP